MRRILWLPKVAGRRLPQLAVGNRRRKPPRSLSDLRRTPSSPPAQLARFTAAGAVGVCRRTGVCRHRAQVAVVELFAVVGCGVGWVRRVGGARAEGECVK